MRKENKKINFKYNLSEYWNLLEKNKIMFFIVFIIAFIITGLGMIENYLFKIIIDDGTDFTSEIITKNQLIETLTIVAIIFLTTIIIRSLLEWSKHHYIIKLESNLMFRLKEKYFRHIIKLSHKFHATHKTGSLISRMNRGAYAIESLTDIFIFNFAPFLFGIIVVAFSIFYFDKISTIIIFAIATVFISYSILIQKIQQKSRLELNSSSDTEKGSISDIITNIDSIKYFGKEKFIEKKYKELIEDIKNKFIKYCGYYRWFGAGQILILGLGTFSIIYLPLRNFLNGTITLGTIVFIYTAYGKLATPMFRFVGGIKGFYRSLADMQDLFEYGKIKNEIKNQPNAKKLEIQKGEIEFKDVSFHYEKKKAFCLDNFNLKIKPNEKIAFVGHSGCGKSTLLKLLYRFYDVQKGEILIDQKKIKKFKQESLRQELSIVPQECILFDDTIFNNIKFANPKAKKEDVFKAIKFAQLSKVIEKFPDKENTIVGERGVKLSGGEKQRISIARAILANKKILVLDEATSALDSKTEFEIQKSLKKLLNNRTSIIIAHRLSTIMNADRIIVMKKGKIIQEGKHKELIKTKGEYQKLWNLQKGGYIK